MRKVSTETIVEDNAFFQRMLAMVPANALASEQQKQDPTQGQQNVGSSSKDTPATNGSPSSQKREKQKQNKDKKRRKREHPFTDDDQKLGSINSYTALKAKKLKKTTTSPAESPIPDAPSPTTTQPGSLLSTSLADIDEKRAKLRAKIEELQAKRKLNDGKNRKRLKRQESKMRLKEKRLNEHMMKNKAHVVNGGDTSKGSNSANPTTPSKPIFNKEGQMVFSKFDFTDSAKKQKKGNNLKGKDYKRLLEKIEKRNEKIKKVTSKDEEKGKSLQDKYKWDSVLQKAEGQKVKDNPELLKKALKRKEKIRDKKKQKWEDRTQTVKKLQDGKIKKRTDNLQKRKQAVKDKKVQKLKKKGRLLPGF